MSWLHNWLVAFDQWANTGAHGAPDVTISARAAIARDAGLAWGILLCKVLDSLDACHCEEAIQSDLQRARDAIEFLSMHEKLTAIAVKADAKAEAKGVAIEPGGAAAVVAEKAQRAASTNAEILQ
jgi:hypothetical protein